MNNNNAHVLESERLYLRTLGTEDVDMYYPALMNEDMRRLTGTQALFTREGVVQFIEESAGDSSRIDLLICLKSAEQIIGEISLMDIDRTNRNAHIRVAIFESSNCGQGYGTEAMKLLLHYAFGTINLHRVELAVFSFNERAIRSYEKLGFQREGVQREVLYYDYEYHDAISMSILAREFRQLQYKQ